MDPKSIAETMKAFETILSDATVVSRQVDKLLNSQLRSYARSSISQLIYEAFMAFYKAILSKDSGYEDPESLILYKLEQVKAMVDAL